MARYRIAWLPGDGIGVEVMAAARIVLDALKLDAEYVPGDIGWEFWRKEGEAFPPRTIDLLKGVDAALFGAITSKPAKAAEEELSPALKGQGIAYRSPIVRMRQLFDLYVCLRPCKAYPGNPLNFKEGIDLVVFRENTEDLYAGVEFAPVPPELKDLLLRISKPFAAFKDTPLDQYAISCKVNTRKGSERIARAAFEFAAKCGRRKVTIDQKTNDVRASDDLFLDDAREMARPDTGIDVADAITDALCMWLLRNPFNYDVIVAPNLYGDIISDLCAQLAGDMGFACSGNIGDKLAVFEPTHGSAPRHAGRNECNPIATILAARMMLEWLGEKEMAARVEKAVAEVIREGKVRTYDTGGRNSTTEMGEAVAGKL